MNNFNQCGQVSNMNDNKPKRTELRMRATQQLMEIRLCSRVRSAVLAVGPLHQG